VRPARLDSGQTVEARIAPKGPGSHGQQTTGVDHFSKAVRNRVLRSPNQTDQPPKDEGQDTYFLPCAGLPKGHWRLGGKRALPETGGAPVDRLSPLMSISRPSPNVHRKFGCNRRLLRSVS
jgi:hypothetical protein